MTTTDDHALRAWLADGPERGPRETLDAALARTRQTSQRPAWAIPERWLPMQLTMRRTNVLRLVPIGILVLLLTAILVVTAVVATRRHVPAPFGPAANGAIAYDAGDALYVLDAEGGGARPLATGLGHAFTPTYSPDGTKIAFWARPGADGPLSLFVTSATGDGTAIRVSDDVAFTSYVFEQPTWSPDGGRLAFSAGDQGIDRIYVANADGSGAAPVSDRSRSRSAPIWSPDGRWLAYQAMTAGAGDVSLAVSSPDGTNERDLVTVPAPSDSFLGSAWAPDSQRIAYWRDASSGTMIGVVGFDGREQVASGVDGDVVNPVWAPDGSRVAYVDLVHGLITVRPDGTDRQHLADYTGDCGLAWSPDGHDLLGSDCHSLIRVPVDHPDAATPIAIVGESSAGSPSWQRIAP